MAIYHCSIKIVSRGKGKSAVAAAAYRSGETIKNDYDGITHDYTRKGGIVHTEILLPDHAPREYADRSVLWNAVGKIEKGKNSQLAREIELALPAELTFLQNRSLVREYVKRHFASAGMCADVCIHDKNDGKPHAHIMLTMRPIEQDGTWGAKQKKEYILDTRWQKIADLKTRAKLLVFLQDNNITDIPTLADKITQLYQSQYDLAGTIKKEERRISTLNQHFAQVDVFKRHKAVYSKYKSLDPKKQSAFYDKNFDEISAYQSASKYLKDHLSGRDKIPDKSWLAERDKLLTQRHAHVEEYYKLRDEVASVETLRRNAESMMRDMSVVEKERINTHAQTNR